MECLEFLELDPPFIFTVLCPPSNNTMQYQGIHYNKETCLLEDKPGSFYFFIPQIELNEFERYSLLASTLVWDDTLCHTFDQAIHLLEYYLHQVIHNGPPTLRNQDSVMSSIGRKPFFIESKDLKMINLSADDLLEMDARCLEQEEQLGFYQSYYRHSTSICFGTNKFFGPHEARCSIKECANINVLWSSLIIEECVRLGLTYFCIAPGSRSSPLAVSACSHSLTTCISCYDERSLAYHAVGYGRGSNKPAVVITSSGTAVSNLLPAVVEASHDFVPVLLLTADRPPELQDAGANQAIDQVNHFGNFVRFFFSLPPPTDQIPARMVLTTIDSAVYSATQAPCGPVHINCPFREPLENFPRKWSLNCLRGIDFWISESDPFTKYIKMEQCLLCDDYHGQISEVLEIMQSANRGLLLIGAIHTEDEMWAALLLVKHLSWPVVSDVLSGLRLRKVFTTRAEVEGHFMFIDHMDHALLSDSVKMWAQPDVVVQIGSKITSKRLGQFLESSSQCSYILVDKHPRRYDPYHIITHRVQSSITQFSEVLLTTCFPRMSGHWGSSLKALNEMVAHEISFQIQSECLLTEPHVAQVIGEELQDDSAIYIGNSMVIRDLDMYGSGWIKINDNIYMTSNWDLQFHGFRISGNRGASGIDGLLSTAIGFAAGCNKRVLCMIGDISFLHDTNGLAILNQRIKRKPMTILVINNHGGAIFSLLPIANIVQPNVLNQYFYTSHDVSVSELCAAHSVKHLLVRTKSELRHALWASKQMQADCLIEVCSRIAENADFHRTIRSTALEASERAMTTILELPISEHVRDGISACKVHKMEYSLYRIELSAPPTSSLITADQNRFYREGFIVTILLNDGSSGVGEVAPIEIHREDLLDVEMQLRFLLHKMEGLEISYFLPLFNGFFSRWIWRSLGIPPSSMFPSVRCGIEMAVLNALAARQGSSLLDLIRGQRGLPLNTQSDTDDRMKKSENIQISALIDCNGTPTDVAYVVSRLVNEGFTTIKLKVARRENPNEDVAVIKEIRQTVGYQLKIRVDANRRWTYKEAIQFGLCVKSYNLQYIEEPVCLEDDIINFCEESGLPVALDETIDNLKGDVLHKLHQFVHPGIVALVIKPSVVGGFENATLIAKWAQMHDKMAVISSAFESSLSLSAYIQFAYYLEKQNETIFNLKSKGPNPAVAHGLGTYRWLKEDIAVKALRICVPADGDAMEASVEDAANFLQCFQVNIETIRRTYKGEVVKTYKCMVDGEDFSCSVKLDVVGDNTHKNVIVFLHGFLGTSHDWVPIMKAISANSRCISIDLPGHGDSNVMWHINKKSKRISFKSMVDILMKLICEITSGSVILVGYSMGARIALYMALKYDEKIARAVLISGSPGLLDEETRRIRTCQDEARARYLLSYGLLCFLKTWYEKGFWKSLREHPHFQRIMENRAEHHDIQSLAKTLTGLSIGRQIPLWNDLKQCKKHLLFIVGEKDTKFKHISQQMLHEVRSGSVGRDQLSEMAIVPDCGHAVHLENPLAVIDLLSKFLSKSDGK